MLRGLVVAAVALMLIAALSPVVNACPTSLNLIPSVDVMEPYTLSIQYENDGYPNTFQAGSDNLYYFQMGITPKLEAGVDFLSSGGETKTLLNAKYQFFSETEKHPALSVGAMSIGAGPSPVYYAVAAKTFGKPRLHIGAMGNGDGSEIIGGVDLSLNDSLCLMSDYIGGSEGFASIGACLSPKKGPAYLLVYGFANDSSSENLCFLNVAWELKLK